MTGERSPILVRMSQAVLDGDEVQAAELAEEILASGISALSAINDGCIPGIREAGQLWEQGEYFLPELVTSAQAMKAAMAILNPALEVENSGPTAGRVVLGTIEGDIHDIGKTLVGTMLSANGFEVHDEGCDVPVARFVERARETQADLICASALLTTTMLAQRDLVKAVREAGLPSRIMVGGAPVTQEWADAIGADGYADNAVSAIGVANRLVARHEP